MAKSTESKNEFEDIESVVSEMDIDELRPQSNSGVVSVVVRLDDELIRSVIADLIDVQGNNGYVAIGMKHGISGWQVRNIDIARLNRISELAIADLEPVEPVEDLEEPKDK